MNIMGLLVATVLGFLLFAFSMWMQWDRLAAIGFAMIWLVVNVMVLERFIYLWNGK